MGLLELPQELRDNILSFIFTKPQNTITVLSNADCLGSEVSAGQPAVSKVNKQLRTETLPLFYSSNVFLAELSNSEDLVTAKNWLAAVGDANIKHLRHLVLSGWIKVRQTGVAGYRWQHRLVRMAFDLRDGHVCLNEDREVATPTPSAMWSVDGLKQNFREMVETKGVLRFTAVEVGNLMEDFHDFCDRAG